MGPLHSLRLGVVSEDSVWSQEDALREVGIERKTEFFPSIIQSEIENKPPIAREGCFYHRVTKFKM